MKALLFTLATVGLCWAEINRGEAAELSATARIKTKLLFVTPLEWVGPAEPSESDSAALLAAIEIFESGGPDAGFNSLAQFLSANSRSAWAPSAHSHVAGHYLQVGRYSLALSHWEQAWEGTKTKADPAARRVAGQTLAGWTQLLASLGRRQQIDEVLAEAKQLGMYKNPYTPRLEAIQSASATMRIDPKIAYRCGSFAVAHVLRALDPGTNAWQQIYELPSPDGGFTLLQLAHIAASNGLHWVAASKPPGGEIAVPSVVHWKLDHYAAIVEKKGSRFRVMDPTFGGERWIENEVIQAEASGNFLIAESQLPSGWKRLSPAEAASVRGKGYPHVIDDDDDDSEDENDEPCPPPPPPEAGDGPGGGEGESCPVSEESAEASEETKSDAMAIWRISEPYITLWIHDTPLFYQSSVGERMALKLSYKHRSIPRGNNVCGFGDKWECNWIGFLETIPGNPDWVTNYVAGGGRAAFHTNSALEYKTARWLAVGGGSAPPFSIQSPYGRRREYGFPLTYGDGTKRFFTTNNVDAYGRLIACIFESYTPPGGSEIIRLTQVIDKGGRTNTLAYANTNFPYLITCVTNPYGNTATFIYDAQGQLTNITDMAGLVSSFKYDTDGSITNLNTAYGNTAFKYYSGTVDSSPLNRAIEITEPTGDKQLYVYRDGATAINMGNYLYEGVGYRDYRNSLHWDRQQYAALSTTAKTNQLDMPEADYWKGSLKHWLKGPSGVTATVTGTLLSSAGAVVDTNTVNRVYSVKYTYHNQTNASVIGALKKIVRIDWDDDSKLEIPRNSKGRPEQFIYYRNGGAAVSFTNVYNAGGTILLKVWGPNGEQTRGYGYHPTITNLLTSVTNAVGDVLRFTHDSAVRVTSITHPGGLVTSNIYFASGASAGFLQTRMDLGFATNHYAYTDGKLSSKTNELGLVTTYTWDNLKRRTSIGFPDGTTISNVYDSLDLVGVKDRLNSWTRFGYNKVRQLIASTNENGRVTQYEYCGCGASSQITEWNGATAHVTQYAYDIAGRLTNAVFADGYTLSYRYTAYAQRLDRIQDSSGRAVYPTLTDYGQVSGLSLSQPPGNALWTREFDNYGRVKSFTDRNGIVTTNGYDFLNRLTVRHVQGAGIERFTYGTSGIASHVNELGYTNWFARDAKGRLLYETNAENQVLRFTYNRADQLLTLTDGKNQTTTWNYDEYGRVTNKLDQASTEIFRYKYDPNGQLTNRWTVAKGDTFYRYDPAGNLTNIDYPGTIMDAAMQYDPLDRLTNVVDAVGTTRFTYTAADQLLSEDGPWASDTMSYSYSHRRRSGLSLTQPNASPWAQSYLYDAFSRLTNVTSAAGQFGYTYGSGASDRVNYLYLPGSGASSYIQNSYDSLARLTATALHTPHGSPINQHSYSYNEGHQRTNQTFTAGNYVDYAYDKIGQLKRAKGWESGGTTLRLQEQLGYEYDAAGNLNRRTNNALVQTLNTDNRNQLTNATRTGTLTVAGTAGQRKAAYAGDYGVTNVTVSGTGLSNGAAELYVDGNWARTNAALADGNNTYTATGQDNNGRTSQDSVTVNLPATVTFQYDGNGNLTNDGRRRFEYDVENQLTNVYVANAWRSVFQYDAVGRRRSRKEYTWNSAWVLTNEVRYVYDGLLAIQERDANNLAQVTYTRGNDLSGTLQGAGGIGGLLARTENSSGSHAYYHCDGNGNVTALVSTNGIILARYHYDPFGNVLAMSGSLADANSYRFSSKEWDPNSSTYYYGFRYYEPNLQRWLNQDQHEYAEHLPEGPNLFGFVGNDPADWVDDWGLSKGRGGSRRGPGGSPSQGIRWRWTRPPPPARQRQIEETWCRDQNIAAARRRAVDQAWRQEQALVRKGKETYPWTRQQREELLRTGRVEGFHGHHVNNVRDHPWLAGNPNNVEFLSPRDHFIRHLLNWRTPTEGPLLNRSCD